jgi:hypothetical protein
MHLTRLLPAWAALALGVLLALGAAPAGAQSDEEEEEDFEEDARSKHGGRRGQRHRDPDEPLPACFHSGVEEAAQGIESCMRAVMFPHQFGEQGEPEVSAGAAALVCRGARTADAGRHLAQCVKRLLYERSGLGERRPGVSAEAAAMACRYATSEVAAENVEDCMKRLLYERSGLGQRREGMTATAAAEACRGTVAPVVEGPYGSPQCVPPRGGDATLLVEECVRRLLYRRGGLGDRREGVSAEIAIFACQGALSGYP